MTVSTAPTVVKLFVMPIPKNNPNKPTAPTARSIKLKILNKLPI
ncbi:MAG: hypothetical protein ACW98X_25930 [Promethearchaeota archaeon]